MIGAPNTRGQKCWLGIAQWTPETSVSEEIADIFRNYDIDELVSIIQFPHHPLVADYTGNFYASAFRRRRHYVFGLSGRPADRPKPEIPSFDLYMGPLVHPTNHNRFTACEETSLDHDQTGPKTSPEPHRRIADPHRRITITF